MNLGLITVLTFSLFTSLSVSADAKNKRCKIESYSNLIFSSDYSSINPIKKSTCTSSVNKVFTDMIASSNGSANTKHVASLIIGQQELKNFELEITPNIINIKSLDEFLSSKINTPKGLFFKESKITSPNKLITLTAMDGTRIICKNCNKVGEKNIKIVITNILKNTEKSLWINSKLKAQINTLQAKSQVGYGEDAKNNKSFIVKQIFTLNPENFVSPMDDLSFKRLNRPIKRGEALMIHHLADKNLVQTGQPASIKLVNNTLVINGKALPLQNGKFGEVIKLKNIKTNKTIFGKVIGKNKIEIEI